jgi:hypothetical protein
VRYSVRGRREEERDSVRKGVEERRREIVLEERRRER